MANFPRLIFGALCAIAAAGFGAPPAHAQSDRAQCGGAINYENADIRTVVDEIAVRTGRKFVLHPRVQGQVTVKSGPDADICPDEAWELFQAMLRVSGFTATPINGDSYRIVPSQEGARSASFADDERGGALITQIVRLRHIDAREAAANINQIVAEPGVVAPVRSGNALIIVDTADNLRRLRQVLRQIDQDTTIYRTVQLNNASAADVARVVRGLAQEISEENGQGRRASVVPVEASNSILIRAEPTVINRLSAVVTELDRIGETQSDLSVIFLKHTDAEEMAGLLREVANAQLETEAAQGAPPTGRSRVSISAFAPTNSVIISGDADLQRTLKDVVAQQDVRRAQVLVEAIIVDISDSTARDLGIEYFVSGDGSENNRVPFTTGNFSRFEPGILAAAGSSLLNPTTTTNTTTDPQDLASAAIATLLTTSGFGVGGVGLTDGGTLFGGVLSAIQQDSESRVLSTPFATTLDNQTASLSVGQEIPISTGQVTGDNFTNAFTTISREEVGVILEVTPQINEGGTVTLEITQEISSVAGPIIDTSIDLITNKTRFTTTALVDDGDILVIGGLLNQERDVAEDKLPILGDIPALGALFRSNSRSDVQRNLMVFIRPTILRDRGASSSATMRKFDYIRGREVLDRGGPQTDIERLIDEVTGVGPLIRGEEGE